MRFGEFKTYAKELLTIALPIIMGNLGFILISAGDVWVAAKHSTQTLAAISIATAIVNCIFTLGIGLMGSVSPVLSNLRGQHQSAKKYFYPTIRFAMGLALITTILMFISIPMIDYLHFSPDLTPLIKQYIFITAFSTFGAVLHMAMKEFLQAFEIVFVPNLVTIFSVILNVLLCILFVFGYGPIPSLGVKGLAIASLLVRYFMGIVLLIYCYNTMKFREHHGNKLYYGTLLKVGLPISFAVLVEFIAFNSIAILMGRISGVYAGAQNLICTLTTISFMVPFAISNAIGVKVGFANGEKNFTDLKRYSVIGTCMGVAFMACSSLIFANFPQTLVGFFTKDAELIKICVPIMYLLSIFQLFDGLQISLAGIFKGIKKTEYVLLTNFTAYWLVSLPLGYYLSFHHGMKLIGFWVGLLCAVIILCIMMGSILFFQIKDVKKKFAAD
ncbi:MAG: MATE family efflux transporter [Clostridiaceae bacterium]|jgi:multidrug resistance protein, MATE family|nr:MATE family efflux transporter [Clostridiaceae bacterium]